MLRGGQSNRYDALRSGQVQRFSANQVLAAAQAARAALVRLFAAPRLGQGAPGRRYGSRFRR